MLVLQIVAGRIIYEVLITLFALTPWYWKLVNKIANIKGRTLLYGCWNRDLPEEPDFYDEEEEL